MLTLSIRKDNSTIRFGPAIWSEADGGPITAAAAAQQLAGKTVLVLVHGYRVDDALDAYARVLLHVGDLYDEVVAVLWPGSHLLLGYLFAQWRAARAGELLAAALAPIRAEVDIEGHSLGCRVTMEALRAGGIYPRHVILTAAAIDNESLQRGERYGAACAAAEWILVAHSRRDRVLRTAYTLGSWDQALGLRGPQRPDLCPANVQALDLTPGIAGHSEYKRCPELFAAWRRLAGAGVPTSSAFS